MHFYTATESGVEPRHYVNMVSRPDELRPSRISDMKKAAKEGEVWVPSVTTVMNVLSKPALESWKIDRHLEQAWREWISSFRAHEDRNLEEYMAEIKRLTELEMDKAPRAGTDIHKVLEEYVKENLGPEDDYYELCCSVFNAIEEGIGIDPPYLGEYESELNFVSSLGYGGQVDLVLRRPGWIIDFKSKQTADKFKPGKMAYDDHAIQLAAYRKGAGLPDARCANVFICLENGEIDFHEHSEADLERGWDMFYHALKLWQIQNGAPQ